MDCNKISSLCSERCRHYLGENPRPGKKCPSPMGTNTQFKFTACYKLLTIATIRRNPIVARVGLPVPTRA